MKPSDALRDFRSHLELKHKAKSTIKSYVGIVSAFINWARTKPDIITLDRSKRVEAYLTYRVQEDDISPSTQNVELNALVVFHRMLGFEIENVQALRARERDRIPPILSREQVKVMLDNFPKQHTLIPNLLYGCGMRVNEVLELRLKDIDFNNEKISVHEAKGDKDRIVEIPKSLMPAMKENRERSVAFWDDDLAHNFNGVNCCGTEKKYPSYPKSREWYWFFPDDHLSTNPETGISHMRHHVMDWKIQRIFIRIREKFHLPIYFSAHKLRHACFTHMAESLLLKGFPEQAVKTILKEIAGHIDDKTIETYIHLARPRNALVLSPLDEKRYSDTVV